ncbi:MAG: hypothetical protein E3K32_05465 [wastewater metagenome]|nr:hypothetical protein [Candidatus Loosdrechtia aerotolerans]
MFPTAKVSDINLSTVSLLKKYLLNEKKLPFRDKTGVSKNRFNRYITYIRMVLNWGLRHEIIKQQDIALPRIKPDPVKRTPPRFFSIEEIKKILDCEKKLPLYCSKQLKTNTIPQTFAMIRFMIATGRRIQEVVCLRKGDIDLDQRMYTITRDKTERTGKPKVFYLSDFAVDVIKPYYDIRRDNEYIFLSQNGTFLTPRAAGQRLKRILRLAGIKDATSKEFRHTFASHMLQSGEPLEAVREHLGHTTVKTTEIYAHLSKNYLKKSINNSHINTLVNTDTKKNIQPDKEVR